MNEQVVTIFGYFVGFLWIFLFNYVIFCLIKRAIVYKFDQGGIVIYFLNSKSHKISFDEILDIRISNLSDLVRFSFKIDRAGNMGNAFFGKSVLIVKKQGWPREIIITPNNPEQFIQDVKTRMARA